MADFTLDEQTAISRAFDAGNYAHAYESQDLTTFDLDAMTAHERTAWILGFFSSCSLDEIGTDDREIFDECYASPAGRYVVSVAKYTDDRSEEYASEVCS